VLLTVVGGASESLWGAGLTTSLFTGAAVAGSNFDKLAAEEADALSVTGFIGGSLPGDSAPAFSDRLFVNSLKSRSSSRTAFSMTWCSCEESEALRPA
jgi:hypothetical protein